MKNREKTAIKKYVRKTLVHKPYKTASYAARGSLCARVDDFVYVYCAVAISLSDEKIRKIKNGGIRLFFDTNNPEFAVDSRIFRASKRACRKRFDNDFGYIRRNDNS